MTPLALALLLATASPTGSDSVVARLPETEITSTRLPYDPLRVPVAYSVVDRSSFATTRLMSLADALAGIPGLFVQSRGGGQDVRITIRGFGARGNGERSNAGNMRGIRVITDGIPVSDPDGRTSLDLVDLGTADRIEVSRSNASALYGNASGGVIHLQSRLDFDRPFVRYEQRVGDFGFHREQAVVGFAAGPTRGTFTFATTAFSGWRRHSQSDATIAQLRLVTPFSERGHLTLLADGASTLNRFPGALTAAELAADPRQADPTFVARDERRYNRIARLASTFEQAIGSHHRLTASMWAEPRKLQRSERDRFRDFNRYHVGANGTWSAEWSRGGLAARTAAGFDEAFLDGSILFYNQVNGARGTTLRANKREGANSAGGFVQQELTWNRRWSALLAMRYDHLRYLSEDFITPSLTASRRFTRFTPKASLSRLAENHTLYAALGGGVEAPAFNEIDPPPQFAGTSFNPLLDAMYSRTWEVGARGRLQEFAGAWRYDAALYWIDVFNDIVPQGGGAYFFTAGESRRRGVELGLEWRPETAVTLRGSGTFSRNEYVKYVSDGVDFGGNEMPGLPAAVFSGAAALSLPRGFRFDTGVEGASRYFADDRNSDNARTFGYGIWNASLAWSRDGERTGVTVFLSGQNLLEKEYVSSVFINGINGRFYEPGLPRNISGGLTLRYH
ncbi:MAG: TonB-dependent receptor [Candidatus Eisenbacteria bacterium]